jgi:hypothetical protein
MPHNTLKSGSAPAPSLVAAPLYSRRGWHLFPVKPGTKHARLSERTTGRIWGRSADPAIVEQMFRRYPHDDIGVATGAISGIIALDVDNKKGKNGLASLEALLRAHGVHSLPHTAIASSPSGDGVHYFFRYPGRHVRTIVSKFGPGLDVLGDGGSAVLPPSRNRHWVTSHGAIASPPSWLVPLLCDEVPRPERRQRREPVSVALQEYRGPVDAAMVSMLTRDSGRGLSRDPEDTLIPDDTDLKIWCALQVVSPSLDYDDWLHIGAAVCDALGDDGFELWDEWSRGSDKYPGPEAMDHKWRECAKLSAYHEDTVYWHADQSDRRWRNGYRVMLEREWLNAKED